jgi:hypothetical protein
MGKKEIWFNRILMTILIMCIVSVLAIVVHNGWKSFRNRNNPCVLENPRQVIGGSITPSKGLFSQGPHMYSLSCKGKRKLTGDVCERYIRVTEKEYERHMYEQK